MGLCHDCPRRCGADRTREAGWCGADDAIRIASICLHRGEEPPISGERGSINLFFAGCNLRCRYCQNHQISRREAAGAARRFELGELVEEIGRLVEAGGHCLNFVSPSHMTRQVEAIVEAACAAGLRLPVVYNTNGYDSVASLRRLEGLVDIYLPDMKYGAADLAVRWSACPDYVERGCEALEEMRRQVGAGLWLDEAGRAERGMIVRHLVLPGQTDNSFRALDLVAEILTPAVHLSLMSQYHPTAETAGDAELDRRVSGMEYGQVCQYASDLGFEAGWFQDSGAPESYRPDFRREHPFEG